MMRSWFILFATTFTMTTLVVSLTTWIIPEMDAFDNQYVILLAVSSALLSLCLELLQKLSIKSVILNILLDITVIFLIVFLTGVFIQLYPIQLYYFMLILILVIVIYIIITLIYHLILTKEAEDMNKKITDWRNKHAESKSSK